MSLRFDITSGARVGQSVALDKTYSTIGRIPNADLRFDYDRDPAVVARHAAVVCRDHQYYLRDLGTTTGTFVNGERVVGDWLLSTGDVVEFGAGGPRATVAVSTPIPKERWAVERMGEPDAAQVTASLVAAAPAYLSRPRPSGGLTAAGVEREVRRRTAAVRRRLAGLAVVMIAAVGVIIWQSRSGQRRVSDERQELLAQVDSLMGAIRGMSVSVRSVRLALDSSEAETARLRRAIGRVDAPSSLELLRRQLRSATARQRQIASAATLDLAAIATSNRAAVAIVIVRFARGAGFTGTGFVVRSGPTSALLVTNRHVLTGRRGAKPTRISVVFDGSSQTYSAELLSTHPTADLAVLRVHAENLPAVQGLRSDSAEVKEGAPVAMLGFPLGLDLPMGGDWRDVGVSATTAPGTVSRVLPNLLQLDAYGAQGASGSPIFDARGDVVAVLFGGERDSAGHIVYGVPVRFVDELLRDAPTTP